MSSARSPISSLRSWLRNSPQWSDFRAAGREGYGRALRRRRIQRLILKTPPIRTAVSGPVEVRALTWRKDWKNLLWSLKSFYQFAGVDLPLFIHDGGLAPGQAERLLEHFPTARLVTIEEADEKVTARLRNANAPRCAAWRARNPVTRKLFDFYAMSNADYVISIDSDIVFFRRPDLLLPGDDSPARNRYNKDNSYYYSAPLDALEAGCGVRPIPLINSGLSLIRPPTIDFPAIERWLETESLFADGWCFEQTLHALCSTKAGVELLPDTYLVGGGVGITPDRICTHYPGKFRHFLYEEGMRHLRDTGFLQALRDAGGVSRVR
jgi:hypothetical protein